MIFIFGSRLMGKVDEVPGMFHVATRFFHVDFLPLIPSESYIVLSQHGGQFRGVRIPLSWRSVVFGQKTGTFLNYATALFQKRPGFVRRAPGPRRLRLAGKNGTGKNGTPPYFSPQGTERKAGAT